MNDHFYFLIKKKKKYLSNYKQLLLHDNSFFFLFPLSCSEIWFKMHTLTTFSKRSYVFNKKMENSTCQFYEFLNKHELSLWDKHHVYVTLKLLRVWLFPSLIYIFFKIVNFVLLKKGKNLCFQKLLIKDKKFCKKCSLHRG